MSTIDVDDEVLVLSFEHFVRPVVRLLERFAGGVVTNENASTCRQSGTNVNCTLGGTGGVARKSCIDDLRLVTYVPESIGSYVDVKNSPGRQRDVPYTSSAVVQWRSSLSAVRIPRKGLSPILLLRVCP